MKPSEGNDSAGGPRAAQGLRIRTDCGPGHASRRRRTSLGRASAWSELGVGGAVEGRSGVSAPDCYSPAPAARVRPRTVAARASCGWISGFFQADKRNDNRVTLPSDKKIVKFLKIPAFKNSPF